VRATNPDRPPPGSFASATLSCRLSVANGADNRPEMDDLSEAKPRPVDHPVDPKLGGHVCALSALERFLAENVLASKNSYEGACTDPTIRLRLVSHYLLLSWWGPAQESLSWRNLRELEPTFLRSTRMSPDIMWENGKDAAAIEC